MLQHIPVAIIGAGPYGLSISAHLHHAGIGHRIFGRSMETWSTGMPSGMFLKSAPAATDLSDPEERLTLKAFCARQGLAYDPLEMPLPVELFTAYGEAFQRELVPHLEPQFVRNLARAPDGFTLTLDDGSVVQAEQVVVATGLRRFGSVPDAIATLPPTLMTHSSEAADLTHLRGQDVIVLGGGSSAVDVAAALHRSGARATLVARRATLRFPPINGKRRWFHAIKAPMTPLGPGWNKVLAWKGALVFHKMPADFRAMVVRRYLGPSPTISVRETIEAHVAQILNATISRCEVVQGRLRVTVRSDGVDRSIEADHIVAATGYRIDLARLDFLDHDIVAAVACTNGYPTLSNRFETSLRGLYFVGTPSAVSFGPIMRFVCGTGFCSRRVTGAIARSVRSARRYGTVTLGRQNQGVEVGTPVTDPS
ncbi:NAD(P)-binding domain-containing protein [Lichenihabitans psoromatis]|uniref:NAD(P)-binding domain-containing protein n=1 Tax=Lichenihabitans psoromatis TaxID=2528642 RepID=UPI0013F1473C|nr:NAD(P)-binding domain-containing protein [Lichenihabitans psoromatis]